MRPATGAEGEIGHVQDLELHSNIDRNAKKFLAIFIISSIAGIAFYL